MVHRLLMCYYSMSAEGNIFIKLLHAELIEFFHIDVWRMG